MDEGAFRQRVFYGGLEPEARPLGWKLLLGVFPAGSTKWVGGMGGIRWGGVGWGKVLGLARGGWGGACTYNMVGRG